MATLKDAIQKAKLEPDSPKSQQLLKYLGEGKFDSQATAEGIDLSKFKNNFQAKANPIQESLTDQRSVAEKEGWMSKISDYVQKNGQPVTPEPSKSFDVYKTESPGSGSVAMIEASKRKEEEKANGEMGLFDRAKNAVVKTGEAISEGLNTVGGGAQNIKGSRENMEYYSTLKKQADQDLANDGDQEKYQKKMAVLRNAVKDEKARENLGLSEIFKGGTRVIGSPAEGVVTGAFEPEMEKVMNFAAEKIGDSEKATDFVKRLDSLAKDHPAMANYLTGLAEVAGLKGGGKVVAKVGEEAIDATKKVVPIVTDAVKKAADSPLITNAVQKTQDMVATAGQKFDEMMGPEIVPETFMDPKVLGRAEELVTPELNLKNFREAAGQGLAVRESKKAWRGMAPDKIDLNQRLLNAKQTLAEKFPNLLKMDDVELPKQIDNEIGIIAKAIKPAFEQIKISTDIKGKIKETWEKIKRGQSKNPDFSFAGVNTMQKNFENEIMPKLMEKFKDAKGKFREANLNDIWELVKGYDKSVPDRVKNATDVTSDSRLLVQKEAWLQNRELLRDTIDSLAETMKDLNAKKSFKQMSDLYQAKEVILKNLKPNKGGEGRIKRAAKFTAKSLLPAGVVGYGVNEAMK